LNKNDCKSCHIIDTKSVGPSYRDVATKYKGDAKAIEYLSNKVIAGGGGVWGDHRMAAHPQISQAEANIIVEYILNINEPKTAKSLPTKGNYDTKIPTGQKENGSYILRAAYKDKGTKVMKSLATEDLIVLRNAKLNPEISDKSKGTQLTITPMRSFSMVGNNAYLAYNNVDLTDINEVEITGQAQTRVGASGGVVEVRIDSPTGAVIGTSEKIEPQEVRFGPAPAAPAGSAAPAAPQRRPPSKFKIAVPANSGQHDVYFVFKNDNAKDTQIIMSVSSIEFKPTGVN